MVAPLGQPDQVKQFAGPLPRLPLAPGQGHGQGDVLDGAQIRDEVARRLLPDEADFLAAVLALGRVR